MQISAWASVRDVFHIMWVRSIKTKTILVMNFIAILLLAGALQVAAAGSAQTVTYSGKSVPVRQVFSEIMKQTGIKFFYDDNDLEKIEPVTVELKNEELKSALQKVIKGRPLEFEIQGNTVFITKLLVTDNLKHQLASPALNAPPVTGIVRGPDGQPIAGANIIVKGTKRGTTTNTEGSFLIEANIGEMIIVSSIGYVEKEILIKTNNVGITSLVLAESKLQEIQIVAYGSVEKIYSTSNINSIKSDQIAIQPVNNPLLALSGRVPGLFVKQVGGVSGSPVNISIQGLNSISQGNNPFYVIDGVPFSAQNSTGLVKTGIPGVGGSNFSYINPMDIERIDILKDADATAIYGSRAANGAILITTKKGKSGKTSVDVNSQTGWGKITKKLDLLNTEQYLEIRKEAFENANRALRPTDYDLNGVWDPKNSKDWQDILIGGTARFTNLQVSISGGNSNTQFLAGSGYVKETTVYPGDLGDKKINVHFNINHKSINNKFKFNLSGSFMQDDNTLAATDLTGIATILPPNAPDLYNVDGSINWSPVPTNPSIYSFDNPIAYLYQKYNAKTYNLLGNTVLGYEILSGLEIKASLGYSRISVDEMNIIPQSSFRPDKTFLQRESNFANKYSASYIIEPQITYKKNFHDNYLDVLLGSTIQENTNYVNAINATGFTNDAQLANIRAASALISLPQTTQSTYRYNALFTRLNYRYHGKYIINLTARRDGSSRFGPESLFNNFYSVGSAWLFGEERFAKLWHGLNYGKLKVSYGTTGNDQIGDYGFLNLYNPIGSGSLPYQGLVGLFPVGHSNPYLQWEETKKLNLGLELGFVNNRILFTGNYYRNRSSNQLIFDPSPAYTGFSSFTRNLPATVQNTGWELLIEGWPVKLDKLNWHTSLNLTVPKNKLIAYPDLLNSYNANTFVIGYPVNIIKAYHFINVNSQTGLYEFESSDKTIGNTSAPTSPDDKIKLIDINPKFYGGLYNSINYKSFSLDFLFQFVKQLGLSNYFGNYPGSFLQNQPTSVYNRWNAAGQSANIQKVSKNLGEISSSMDAMSLSDAAYTDASFIRMKNIAVSYSFSNEILQRTKISQARIFIQGQNLMTITKFTGGDPETQSGLTLPPLKLWTIGIQLTL
jgi:TonB-dependent starch-binding outer membrane protein SusC